ncbi:LRRNT_2 domain-containing protein [Psidium guajava]|nr:LRRNT_2 domain-containing protein [Psidium guajava]
MGESGFCSPSSVQTSAETVCEGKESAGELKEKQRASCNSEKELRLWNKDALQGVLLSSLFLLDDNVRLLLLGPLRQKLQCLKARSILSGPKDQVR